MDTKNAKILIVDDNRDFLVDLKEAFESDGFTVYSAGSGSEAVDSVISVMPDLVIADLRMDDMNGFQLSLRINQDMKLKHIPVFAMSAHFIESNYPGMLKRSGIQEFFLKPLDLNQMMNKARIAVSGNKRFVDGANKSIGPKIK